jgi:transposase
MKRTRRNHGATCKVQVALAAVKGDKTLAELAEQFQVHPTQITEWKQQLLARAADVFGGTVSSPVKETVSWEKLWPPLGPDTWRAAGPPTRHGAALHCNSATIRH